MQDIAYTTPSVIPISGHIGRTSRQFRKALKRRNRLRHAYRVLTAEGIPAPPRLWDLLLRAALEVERLRDEEVAS